MTDNHTVALIGFSAFERSTLEAFFRLAARRQPSYRHVAPEQARIVLVDADNPEALRDARATPARCIYIGARGREGQLGHMVRPINMMSLLKLLDHSSAHLHAAPAPAPAPAPAQPRPVVTALMPTQRTPTALPSRASPPAQPAAARGELQASRINDQILVVDDSDVALRFMANCLGRFGFDVQLAHSGEEALQRVAEDHFEFVFMDVTMSGIDGYQTCKLIKKRPYPPGRHAPAVVMLTSRGGMVDKMRGTLSGCDAYLTKPLQQGELMKVIGERVSAPPAPPVQRPRGIDTRPAPLSAW